MASLYVHIPFCIKKCSYCDFVSFPCADRMDEYLAALLKEIDLAAEEIPPFSSVETVFFGGGTPSLMSGKQFHTLMERLRSRFPIAENAEITLECNPGTVDCGKLAAYRAAGANRLSVGMQSLDQDLLKRIGRIHTRGEALAAVESARAAGFENINVDVMHGLPGQTVGQYLDTLESVCMLPITHVSAYSLILEEGTPLYKSVLAGETPEPDADAAADMQDAGMELLEKHGFHRYEISNFAREGFMCRHNLVYWENREYLGLGLNAHSSLRLTEQNGRTAAVRFRNLETLDGYLAALARNRRPLAETIRLKKKDELFETVMLGLRLVSGVDKAAFTARFGLAVNDVYPEAVEKLAALGWLAETPTHLALNARGLDLQNRALQYFMD